jgi:hypothetical protein
MKLSKEKLQSLGVVDDEVEDEYVDGDGDSVLTSWRRRASLYKRGFESSGTLRKGSSMHF